MRVDPLLNHYPVRIREVTLGVILGISILLFQVRADMDKSFEFSTL